MHRQQPEMINDTKEGQKTPPTPLRKKLATVITETLQNGENVGDDQFWLSTMTRLAHHQRQKKMQRSICTSSSGSAGITLKLSWDRSSNQSVAVKTFSATSPAAFDEAYFNMLKYEVLSMDRTGDHPNIVQLFNTVVSSPSQVCLVMEAAAVSGDDLLETIERAAATNTKDEGG